MSERPRGAAAKKKHQQKKKTPPRVFFFLSGPGERQGKEKPRWAPAGPVPAPNGASPSPAFPRGRSKKKKNTLGGVFFWLWPRGGAQRGFSFPCLSPGPQQKKKHPGWCFFFALAPCRHGASPSPAFPRGRSKKKHPGWCFFLLWPRRKVAAPNGAQQKKHFAHPGPTAKIFLETNDAGHEQKGATTKKTPWPLGGRQ